MRRDIPLAGLVALAWGLTQMTGCTTRAQAGLPAVEEAAGSRQAGFEASVTYLEKLHMPAASVLSVRLRSPDLPPGHAQAVLAEGAFAGLPGPPYAFVLSYSVDQRADARYVLEASLALPSGEVMFATPSPVAIDLDAPMSAPIRLHRIAAP